MQAKVPKVPYAQLVVSNQAIPIYSRGKVFASEVRQITNEVPGLVTSVSDKLSKGANVQKGAFLIQLDEQPFILDIAQKQSELDRAKLEQVNIKAKAVVARKGLKKNASDFALHIPQERHADSQVAAAQAALAYAKKQLKKTTITAPIDGKIIDLNITEGEFIRATSSIAKIYGTQEVEIRLPLNDQQIDILGLGHERGEHPTHKRQPQVQLHSYQNKAKRWLGHIVRTEGERDLNQLLYVIAQVSSTNAFNANRQPLLPGSFVEAKIEGQIINKVNVIPRVAEQASNNVWVIDQDNKLLRKTVDVIYRGKTNAYLRGGLDESDRIVTGSFHLMVEGLVVDPYLEGTPYLKETSSSDIGSLASAVQ